MFLSHSKSGLKPKQELTPAHIKQTNGLSIMSGTGKMDSGCQLAMWWFDQTTTRRAGGVATHLLTHKPNNYKVLRLASGLPPTKLPSQILVKVMIEPIIHYCSWKSSGNRSPKVG